MTDFSIPLLARAPCQQRLSSLDRQLSPCIAVAVLMAIAVACGLGGSSAQAQPSIADTAAIHVPQSAHTKEADTARHPLWRVTSAEDTLHVLGSVHLLRPEAYPLAAPIRAVIADAEKVAFEVDLDSMQAAAPMMLQAGMYPSDSTLQQGVSDQTYAMLTAALDTLQVLPMQIQRMRPWLVSLVLTSAVLQRGGYEIASGIDQHVYRKVQEREVEVVGLESFAEQIAILSSISAEDPDAYLRYSLENMTEALDQIDRIMAAWDAGDAATIAAVMNQGMEAFPAVREQVLVQRNRNWIAPIERLFGTEAQTLVVVGVGHLVGEDSVLAMLQARGYTVTQL